MTTTVSFFVPKRRPFLVVKFALSMSFVVTSCKEKVRTVVFSKLYYSKYY